MGSDARRARRRDPQVRSQRGSVWNRWAGELPHFQCQFRFSMVVTYPPVTRETRVQFPAAELMVLGGFVEKLLATAHL